MTDSEKRCVACDRDSNTVPILTLDYRDTTFGICTQHLPILIHDPTQLTGRLAGAEEMSPSDQQD